MSESRAGNSSAEDTSQAFLNESQSSVHNASEVEVNDIQSFLSEMDLASSMLASEMESATGYDAAFPKASAVQLMVGVMDRFTGYVETEFLDKIVDATSCGKEFQDFTDSLKTLIKYLLEQNQLLLKCLSDIGTEAEKRADLLQQRLRETAVTTRDAVHKISDWGEVLLDLVNQKCLAEQAVFAARCLVEAASEETSRLKVRNENLEHDLHSLLAIIRVARTTGNWEMDCVTFCDLSPEDVYGTICHLSSTQHSDTTKSAATNNPSPDGNASISEVEGINGTSIQNEIDFSSATNHVNVSSSFEHRTWPGRKFSLQDAGTSGRTSYFRLPLYQAPEQPGAESCALVPKASSSYKSTFTSLESIFTPLVPPSVNNEEMWARRRLFPSSSLIEQFTPYQLSDAPHHLHLDAASVRQDKNAQSLSAQMSSLEGTAACDAPQSQGFQKPLGAISGGHAHRDGEVRLPNTSGREYTTAGDGLQPDHTMQPDRITVHHPLSVVEVCTQTEDYRPTYGVTCTQTDAELELSLPTGNVERDQELCSVRERFNLASQEAQSKTLLAMQLQAHLDSSSKQVELMQQALQNLEKKLAASRQECDNLKKEVTSVQGKLEHAEAATKKEQEENAHLKTELQQLSVTVQHLREALVELKKGGVSAAREESTSNFGPKVHNV